MKSQLLLFFCVIYILIFHGSGLGMKRGGDELIGNPQSKRPCLTHIFLVSVGFEKIDLENMPSFECENVDINIDELARALENNSTLRNISLCYLNIDDTQLNTIVNAIKNNSQSALKVINLSLNNIASCGTADLAKIAGNLESLSLYGNSNIGESGVERLVEGLEGSKKLKKLNLGDCGLKNEGAMKIASFLKKNPLLTYLDIEENSIAREGLEAVADALKYNYNLVTLNFCGGNEVCGHVNDLIAWRLSLNRSSPKYLDFYLHFNNQNNSQDITQDILSIIFDLLLRINY